MTQHPFDSSSSMSYSTISNDLNNLGKDMFTNSSEHGFHGSFEKDNVPTKLMLVVSEVAEAMEAHREGNPFSNVIAPFSQLEEELADAIIRILDLNAQLGLNVPGAMIAKHNFNRSRPFMHGNKAY